MYRRNEAFRYSFVEPLAATLTIQKLNEKYGKVVLFLPRYNFHLKKNI
ncbi:MULTISPECIES: hypothetical protein [Bacillus]|nr:MULTISPECIES: hypothetical protein [Bacillus]